MNEIPIILYFTTPNYMTVIKIYSFVGYFFSVKKLVWGYC